MVRMDEGRIGGTRAPNISADHLAQIAGARKYIQPTQFRFGAGAESNPRDLNLHLELMTGLLSLCVRVRLLRHFGALGLQYHPDLSHHLTPCR